MIVECAYEVSSYTYLGDSRGHVRSEPRVSGCCARNTLHSSHPHHCQIRFNYNTLHCTDICARVVLLMWQALCATFGALLHCVSLVESGKPLSYVIRTLQSSVRSLRLSLIAFRLVDFFSEKNIVGSHRVPDPLSLVQMTFTQCISMSELRIDSGAQTRPNFQGEFLYMYGSQEKKNWPTRQC